MTYSIIICEDQLAQLAQIKTIIKNYMLFHSELLKLNLATQNPYDVMKYIDTFQPKQGIYFLDIDLNTDIDGLELAEYIRKNDVEAKIIFMTTHDEYLPLTIKRRVEALGFVAKDQSLDGYRTEIMELLDLAQQRIDDTKIAKNQSFQFSVGSQDFVLDSETIYILEPSDLPHRIKLLTSDGQYEFYGKLTDIETKYPFLTRVSRFCLVNLNNAREINYKKRLIYFDTELMRSFSIGKGKVIKQFLENTGR